MRTFLLLLFMIIFNSAAQAGPTNSSFNFQKMKNFYSQVFPKYHNTSSHKSCLFRGLMDAEERLLFHEAVSKLRDVSKWSGLIGIKGQEFKLYNSQGLGVYREAIQGDYIRIKLPMDPTGRSYWVHIEAVAQKALGNDEESFTIVVRPTENPTIKGRTRHYTDHFFTKEATNTFSVKRTRSGLESRVEGRNERANTTETPSKWDRISNTTISTMGWGVDVNNRKLGFQPLVWRKFNTSLADCEL